MKKILTLLVIIGFLTSLAAFSTGIKINTSTVLLDEDFSGPFPPDGWSTDWWKQCNSSCCGPEPPWACLLEGNYTSAYITSKTVDASNYEKINLRFYFGARFYYPHYSYFFLKVRMNETSPWKDITPWDNPPNHDLEPFIYDIKIILGPGGHADAFQVNWSYMGNYCIHYACLDEVTIYDSHPNNPPNTPEISGPTRPKVGELYDYTVVTTDPDEDNVSYYIDWGDSTVEEWIGPFESGQAVVVCHAWNKSGMYLFRCKAKDHPYEAESDWLLHLITVPPVNKIISNPFFLRFIERFPFLEKLFYLIK